eukprot:TRINITY_DN2851_c0_g1_i2.p1 TRINITY_DN2851_c0_g1~~TRINITY_DN2851_c0_g1_i2.p1  ORF type:complete len:223 (+),score=56.82 TRINITY_DN2851_c0_g1_i2:129-797(+)
MDLRSRDGETSSLEGTNKRMNCGISSLLNPEPMILPPIHLPHFEFIPMSENKKKSLTGSPSSLEVLSEASSQPYELVIEPPISIRSNYHYYGDGGMNKRARVENPTLNPPKNHPHFPSHHRNLSNNNNSNSDDESANDEEAIPIFDDCDEIRRKVRNMLVSGVKVTHWLKEIGGVNSNSYQRFMAQKGPLTGCENRLYYAAYVYFEAKSCRRTTKIEEKIGI